MLLEPTLPFFVRILSPLEYDYLIGMLANFFRSVIRFWTIGALVFVWAGAIHGATPPNIVFILVDDLRWDELRCTGHPFAQSPHADRLAREGANYRNAFATTPLCSPSRASFLTGQYPHRHGIIDNTDRS